MRKVVWMGSSKQDLKAFPDNVVDDMGHQLFLVQCGLEPDDWKPMNTIGTGVREIRVRGRIGHLSRGVSGDAARSGLCVALLSTKKRSKPHCRISGLPGND